MARVCTVHTLSLEAAAVYATACWCRAGDTLASRLAPAARGCKGTSSSSICCLAKFTKTCVRRAEKCHRIFSWDELVEWLLCRKQTERGIHRRQLNWDTALSTGIMSSSLISINFLATSFLWMYLLASKILLFLKEEMASARFAWFAQHEFGCDRKEDKEYVSRKLKGSQECLFGNPTKTSFAYVDPLLLRKAGRWGQYPLASGCFQNSQWTSQVLCV